MLAFFGVFLILGVLALAMLVVAGPGTGAMVWSLSEIGSGMKGRRGRQNPAVAMEGVTSRPPRIGLMSVAATVAIGWPLAIAIAVALLESQGRCEESNLGCGYFLAWILVSPVASFFAVFVLALALGQRFFAGSAERIAWISAALLFLPLTLGMVALEVAVARAF